MGFKVRFVFILWCCQMLRLYIKSSSMEHRYFIKLKNLGDKHLSLGHKESHVDQAGIKPTSAR